MQGIFLLSSLFSEVNQIFGFPSGVTRQTIARNLLLVDRVPSGSKPDDLVRLYETLRQNAQDILDLESVMGHVETRTVAEAEISKFTSLRCFHLARSFQRAGQWTESIVLFERAEKLLSSAATTAEQAEDPQALQLRDFAKECVALRAQAHAQVVHPSQKHIQIRVQSSSSTTK